MVLNNSTIASSNFQARSKSEVVASNFLFLPSFLVGEARENSTFPDAKMGASSIDHSEKKFYQNLIYEFLCISCKWKLPLYAKFVVVFKGGGGLMKRQK